MQKVDIAIAALGAVALLATGLGIGLYDDGNVDYVVSISETQSFTDNGGVPAGGLDWSFEAPDNAFNAIGDLTVSWTGQNPTLSGPVDVTVKVTAPNGHTDTLTGNFDYGAGSGVIALDLVDFALLPSDFSGTQAEADALDVSWDSPLTVEIVIQGPSGQVAAVNQDDAVYTASLDAHWRTFSVAPETPDLGTI